MNKKDDDLAAHMVRIKAMGEVIEPGQETCLDFSIGDNCGVRVLIGKCGDWVLSVSIGRLEPEKYTPMPVSEWAPDTAQAAANVTKEVLEYFDIEHSTMKATRLGTVMLLRFREVLQPFAN